jgi:predicted TIM-barrel fold metal-dependent hydrolase
VALQFPDLAVQQLEHAIKRLHMCGVAVGASVAGYEFSDPMFHPFWAKCEELGWCTHVTGHRTYRVGRGRLCPIRDLSRHWSQGRN